MWPERPPRRRHSAPLAEPAPLAPQDLPGSAVGEQTPLPARQYAASPTGPAESYLPPPDAYAVRSPVPRVGGSSPSRRVYPAAQLPPGTVIAERYIIESEVGRGAMSVVYAARDSLLHRPVALKMFAARDDSDVALREQEAEAKIVASLNHNALVTLFDAGVETLSTGRPQIFLSMERVVGRDLKARIRDTPLTPSQVCWMGYDLAEALDFVHGAGFLHRDLKPGNVLIADKGFDGRLRAKLADFGISSLIGTMDGDEVQGTIAYLSPEQVQREPLTPASDVYSLGLVLLEALTGRLAFPGTVEVSAAARLQHDPEIPSSVPREIADILRGMTARRPETRMSLEEVMRRFQDLLIGEIIESRRAAAVPGTRTVEETEHEIARLAMIRRLSILDTPPEAAYDRIARLAGAALQVPVAIVSVIDSYRAWATTPEGWDFEAIQREINFHSVLLGGAEPRTVTDALTDPRTASNALVTGSMAVRAYAAMPLATHDGHILGTLSVLDREPREFTARELGILSDLATLVMDEFELRAAARGVLLGERAEP